MELVSLGPGCILSPDPGSQRPDSIHAHSARQGSDLSSGPNCFGQKDKSSQKSMLKETRPTLYRMHLTQYQPNGNMSEQPGHTRAWLRT